MAIICRMLVHESERVLILIELDARFVAPDDFAERARLVAGHRTAP
jgi:hypothetical protein